MGGRPRQGPARPVLASPPSRRAGRGSGPRRAPESLLASGKPAADPELISAISAQRSAAQPGGPLQTGRAGLAGQGAALSASGAALFAQLALCQVRSVALWAGDEPP